jgi:DNA-directed RNA polymerase sigma subunit (sigma70/sigma32)
VVLRGMDETCCLDVADRGGTTLETIAQLIGLTRERIRQVEVRALLKLKMNPAKRRRLGDEEP